MKAVKALLYSMAFMFIYLFMQLIFSVIFMIPMMMANSDIFFNNTNQDMIMEMVTKASLYSLPFCIIATFFIYWLIFYMRNKNFIKTLSLNKVKVSTLLLAIFFSISFYPVIAFFADFLTKIYPNFSEIQNIFDDMFQISVLFSIIYVCFMGPIMEEIVTRGLIFSEMKSGTNFLIAIIIQALFFGIMHMNMVQGTYAFILGVVYGIFREKFNSLLIVIICHIVHNSYSVALDYLPDSISNSDMFMNIYLAVSIIFLVVSSVLLYFNWKKHYKVKYSYDF